MQLDNKIYCLQLFSLLDWCIGNDYEVATCTFIAICVGLLLTKLGSCNVLYLHENAVSDKLYGCVIQYALTY